MKFWKHTLLSAIAFIGVSSSVLYTSCVKDNCDKLRCTNGGVCENEVCNCKTGYEGTECEKMIALRFVGIYDGVTSCNNMPPAIDSAVIGLEGVPDIVNVKIYSVHGEKKYVGTIKDDVVIIRVDSTHMVINVAEDRDKITIHQQILGNENPDNCVFTGYIR